MGKRRTKNVNNLEAASKHGTPFDSFEEYRRQKGCVNKVAYHSEEYAYSVAQDVMSTRKEKNIAPYKCKYCEDFHIGHRY